MDSQNNLSSFLDDQRNRYGEFFWYETRKLPDNRTLFVFMAEKMAIEARTLVKSNEFEIVSFEKDERFGNFFTIDVALIKLLNTPSKQEYESITEESYISEQPINLNNDLIKGELLRVFRPVGQKFFAVVVYHNFENRAPRILGRIKDLEGLRQMKVKEFVVSGEKKDFIDYCRELEGIPYTLGGKSKKHGFDCSGLTQEIVYKTKDLWLPRKAQWQAIVSQDISQDGLQQGDLMFFREKGHENIDHVAFVFEPQQGRLPVIFHTKKIIGKAVFQDLNSAEWLKDWEIVKFGRVPIFA